MKPFRVQLIGGIVLHQGRIAEMKTGEGKTLVAVLPAYLNALTGEGVHIVTVNDYLAKRDRASGWARSTASWACPWDLSSTTRPPRSAAQAYNCDITYGTNNEMGFDYLRDNMAIYKEEMVQRGHSFAIVDEVDSILIDEARTPLIISGQGDGSPPTMYQQRRTISLRASRKMVVRLGRRPRRRRTRHRRRLRGRRKGSEDRHPHPRGIAKAEQLSSAWTTWPTRRTATLSHHINQAIKAHGIMKRDIDYVVKDGEVIIVDEFTGRLMLGRRYSTRACIRR
jgi:preprotein translocase subunit SecA